MNKTQNIQGFYEKKIYLKLSNCLKLLKTAMVRNGARSPYRKRETQHHDLGNI